MSVTLVYHSTNDTNTAIISNAEICNFKYELPDR